MFAFPIRQSYLFPSPSSSEDAPSAAIAAAIAATDTNNNNGASAPPPGGFDDALEYVDIEEERTTPSSEGVRRVPTKVRRIGGSGSGSEPPSSSSGGDVDCAGWSKSRDNSTDRGEGNEGGGTVAAAVDNETVVAKLTTMVRRVSSELSLGGYSARSARSGLSRSSVYSRGGGGGRKFGRFNEPVAENGDGTTSMRRSSSRISFECHESVIFDEISMLVDEEIAMEEEEERSRSMAAAAGGGGTERVTTMHDRSLIDCTIGNDGSFSSPNRMARCESEVSLDSLFENEGSKVREEEEEDKYEEVDESMDLTEIAVPSSSGSGGQKIHQANYGAGRSVQEGNNANGGSTSGGGSSLQRSSRRMNRCTSMISLASIVENDDEHRHCEHEGPPSSSVVRRIDRGTIRREYSTKESGGGRRKDKVDLRLQLRRSRSDADFLQSSPSSRHRRPWSRMADFGGPPSSSSSPSSGGEDGGVTIASARDVDDKARDDEDESADRSSDVPSF